MRKTILFIASVLLISLTGKAGVVTVNQAKQTAQQFVNKKSATFKAAAGHQLKLAHQGVSRDGTPDYYVFNLADNGGFVVVSGEDRVQSVSGYSDHGSFDFKKLPENVKWWFSEYQRQMQYLREHPQVRARKTLNLNNVVEPMITTKWNQCKPYNDLCPVSPSDDDPYWVYGNRACAGCVAIALCQVMNYYKWPVHGQGSSSYTFDLDGTQSMTLSADYSQSYYQWDLMKDEYLYMDMNNYGYFDENYHVYIKIIDENGDTITDPNGIHSNAVAKLVSDVGIACEMMYSSAGSGAYTYYAYYALWDHFSYLPYYNYRDDFQGDWDAMLREELDMHHPFYYSGHTDESGHAFVLDGYDEQGRFHVNWGWGGWYDGYFETLSLDPDGTGAYQSYQEMISPTPYLPISSTPESGESIDFGYVPMGSNLSKSVTVYGMYLDENNDLTVTITGAGANQFNTVATLSTAAVNQAEGLTFDVYYQPTAWGSHSAQLKIDGAVDFEGNPLEPIILSLTGYSGLYYDANEDGLIDVSDVTAAIDACLNNHELNYLGRVPDVSDVVELIDYVLAH